jgi:hypothetical protein
MRFLKFEKGKKIPPPFDDRVLFLEGCIFEMDDAGAPCIVIYYQRMTDKEANEIENLPIYTGYFADPPYWFGVMQIGNSQFELEFDPKKYIARTGYFSKDIFRENKPGTIVGVDSMSLIIKALRIATYPPQLLNSLYFTYSKFSPHDMYSDIYSMFLADLRRYDVPTLWDKCTKTGCFGDRELSVNQVVDTEEIAKILGFTTSEAAANLCRRGDL